MSVMTDEQCGKNNDNNAAEKAQISSRSSAISIGHVSGENIDRRGRSYSGRDSEVSVGDGHITSQLPVAVDAAAAGSCSDLCGDETVPCNSDMTANDHLAMSSMSLTCDSSAADVLSSVVDSEGCLLAELLSYSDDNRQLASAAAAANASATDVVELCRVPVAADVSVNLPLVEDGLSSGHASDADADVDNVHCLSTTTVTVVCHNETSSAQLLMSEITHTATLSDDSRAVTCTDRRQQVPVCITRSGICHDAALSV